MAAPTIQTESIVFSNVTANTLTAGWTRGDGGFLVVFATAASGGDLSDGIVDGESYSANATFGNGTQPFGYPGWYCAYNGFGVSAEFRGLSAGTTYTFQAFEYNGSGGEEAYLVGTSKGNPATVTMLQPVQMH